MSQVERVLVIGCGYAGARFATALNHLRANGFPLEIVGFCDQDPARVPADGTGFTDLRAALAELSPTVVCVTVNEAAHAAVLTELASYREALILAEKPLTADLAAGERVARAIRHHAFSMNLVERFSPIVRDCREWLAAQGPFQMVRAESFWGKSRINDPRPTIGVLSELIHPLDLMRHVFGLDAVKIVSAAEVASDFSPHSGELPDSLDVHAVTEHGAPFVVHSSFAWAARMRRVTGFIRSATGLSCVELVFDTPHWDCDRLTISAISETGRWQRVHELSVGLDDLPADIRGVGKVVRFIETSLRAWRAGMPGAALVDLTASLELQRLLEEIELMTSSSVAAPGYGGAR